MERLVILSLHSLVVHFVPLAGHHHLVHIIQHGRVERVSVDEADQILFVVFPAVRNRGQKLRFVKRNIKESKEMDVVTRQSVPCDSVSGHSLAQSGMALLSLDAAVRVSLLASLVLLLHHSTLI